MKCIMSSSVSHEPCNPLNFLQHVLDMKCSPCSRLKPLLPFVSWNQEGWKTGLCSVPPVGHSHSLLAVANNTCVKPTFMDLRERFTKLYRKKVHFNFMFLTSRRVKGSYNLSSETIKCFLCTPCQMWGFSFFFTARKFSRVFWQLPRQYKQIEDIVAFCW